MAATDRSFAEVLQDIIGNVREIVRSEVRFAKTEVWEEAAKSKLSAQLLCAGAITAVSSILFLLLTAVYALSMVMPQWAAALTVGLLLAFIASSLLTQGIGRFKKLFPATERNVEIKKENIEWSKQPSK